MQLPQFPEIIINKLSINKLGFSISNKLGKKDVFNIHKQLYFSILFYNSTDFRFIIIFVLLLLLFVLLLFIINIFQRIIFFNETETYNVYSVIFSHNKIL